MELHGRDKGLGNIEEALQGDVNDTGIVLEGHQGHYIVPADTGVVDAYLDILVLMSLLPGLNG